MSKAPTPLFLERRSYRQRRLMDAARLMPLLGGVLWVVPLLWGRAGEVSTSTAMLYIFGVWLLLAGLALMLSVKLEDSSDEAGTGEQGNKR